MSTEPNTRRRWWLVPLLLGSLAVNLLIVGIVIGWILSPGGPRGHRTDIGPARGLMGEPFVRALAPEDRARLIASIARDRGRIRENREALGRRLEALIQAIRADTFDEDALRQLLDEQRQAAIGRQKIGETLLIERLADMSAEERAAYADRLKHLLRRVRPRSR